MRAPIRMREPETPPQPRLQLGWSSEQLVSNTLSTDQTTVSSVDSMNIESSIMNQLGRIGIIRRLLCYGPAIMRRIVPSYFGGTV